MDLNEIEVLICPRCHKEEPLKHARALKKFSVFGRVLTNDSVREAGFKDLCSTCTDVFLSFFTPSEPET